MPKVRISRELYGRACECAAEVQEPVGRWMRLAQLPAHVERAERHLAAAGVVIPVALMLATREDSVCATVQVAVEDGARWRRNVAAGVVYCEMIRPPAVVSPLREGVDYLVERWEDS